MSDEEVMHDDIDNNKMKLSRYDIDPQYNDPDPDYHPRPSVLPVESDISDIYVSPKPNMERIFDLIRNERHKQDTKWGEQNHEARSWTLIALEEFGEVAKATLEEDYQNFIVELVQTAAVMTAWLENELRKLETKGTSIEDVFNKHD